MRRKRAVIITEEDLRRFGYGPYWTPQQRKEYYLGWAKELRQRRQKGRREALVWRAILLLATTAYVGSLIAFGWYSLADLVFGLLFFFWLGFLLLGLDYPSEKRILEEELKAYKE